MALQSPSQACAVFRRAPRSQAVPPCQHCSAGCFTPGVDPYVRYVRPWERQGCAGLVLCRASGATQRLSWACMWGSSRCLEHGDGYVCAQMGRWRSWADAARTAVCARLPALYGQRLAFLKQHRCYMGHEASLSTTDI
jgi:hypothetical protein